MKSKMANISQEWLSYVGLLLPFTRNYWMKRSGSSLARELNKPQRSVARGLNVLEKARFVSFTHEGRDKKYFLSSGCTRMVDLFCVLERVKEINFRLRHRDIDLFLGDLGDVCGVIFGSFAKGLEKKGSDLDLVLFTRKSAKYDKVFRRFAFTVHVHFSSLDNFRYQFKKGNALPTEILKDHILFGDTQKVVTLFSELMRR